MGRKKRQLPLFENVEIISAGAEGKAVGKIDDQVVFVPFAAPGDIVDVKAVRKRRKFIEGVITNYHKKSDLRIEPFCEHFGVCGGCKWQHLPYEEQLKFKQQQVIDNLQRLGQIDTSSIKPILGSEETKYYRNKLEFSFSNRKYMLENEPILEADSKEAYGLGFHVPRIFDKVLDLNSCYLMAEPANAIRLELKKYTLEKGYSYYNIRTWEGFLRNIVIRSSNTGDLMVNLVVREEDPEAISDILDHLKSEFPEITSLFYTINGKKNDSLSDLSATYYAGKDHLMATMEELKFKIGPMSFYQTNDKQAYNLYKIAREFADLKGDEIVYDLYTGTGTIANFIAKKAGRVVGIEWVESAIEDAKKNSERNNVSNTSFFAGDMAKVFTKEFVSKNGKPDVIITDPPRAGMHKDVVQQILDLEPQKVVYVSCNPATQARDVSLMAEKYDVKQIQPVDMFPHTHHVENVILLEKK
ncbi:MAG: 23S rRNA (uracil(1939)-C(5))-methyltransferase RlmD [Bacteroidota bacterium]|nr:23S rRNA (uracil(1939)-C(5))-methyltransferase RlmD [Bacteroidota bacterium]